MVRVSDWFGICMNRQKMNSKYDLLYMGEFIRRQILSHIGIDQKNGIQNGQREYPITPRVLHVVTYHLAADLMHFGSMKNFGAYVFETKNGENKNIANSTNYVKERLHEYMYVNKLFINVSMIVRGIKNGGKDFINLALKKKFSLYHKGNVDVNFKKTCYENGYKVLQMDKKEEESLIKQLIEEDIISNTKQFIATKTYKRRKIKKMYLPEIGFDIEG